MTFCQNAVALAAAMALCPLPAIAQGSASLPACTDAHSVYHGDPPPPAPPVQDYEPAPALWKLADEDTTIYIFGTFHALPEGFRWRTPLLDRVIAETDEVVFESRDDEVDPDDPLSAETLRFLQLVQTFRSEVPLSERVAERNRAKLLRLFDEAGIAREQIEYAPPMMSMFMIAVAGSEAEGSRGELGVESVIEADYKANGRAVSAIEDPIAVMTNLFKIDENDVLAMIDDGLDEWDGCALTDPQGADWSSEHSWAQGRLDGTELAEMLEDPFFTAFYQVLLVDRNSAWTDWLVERMNRPGNLLLAVGAGHMEGPDSVILMLEKRGLVTERIQ